jgi:DNA-binding beta-propeller fold protein YncE
VSDTVQVRDGPQTVAADPSTHTAWVVNFKDNSISVIVR